MKKTVKKSSKTALPKGRARKSAKPIELYYWPTPNGWKISIMLEECRLPYILKAVDIGQGDQFKPSFLKIAPNNRMPAIIDPDGPGGRAVSVFESGAILQYLGRKTGKFYPKNERARIEVDEWLFWQMGGLGPMAGQANHFITYAAGKSTYATKRYVDEVNRLFGVMNKRLRGRDFLAGSYSIADMACWGWVVPHKRMKQNIDAFPNLKRWLERLEARPAVQRGFALGRDLRKPPPRNSKEAARARKILFGQRAR